MTLRPRQLKAIEDLRAAYRAGHRSPILCAATGFGKSHTAVEMIRNAVAKGLRVWFIAHLRELLIDASKRLASAKIPHGWIASGAQGDRRKPVQVAMVQTLVRRLDRYEPPDLLIIDEAHLAVAKSYQDILAWAPNAKRLLLTATPTRLDGRGMGEVADVIIPTCSTQDLIDEGLLAPIRYYAPDAPDMTGVRTTAGEFNGADVRALMDKPKITGSAVAHYRKLAHGRPAIAFCVSIEHANHVASEFRAAGYRAAAISGDSDQVERDAALQGLQAGQLDVVCNCALWVAGVDAPAVSVIILLAPTQSVTKYLQSVGRGLRTHPGKPDCIVLDHAGNIARHGHPCQPREWTLEGAEKKKAAQKSEVPVKTCPACFAVVHSATTHCSCGHQFAPTPRVLEQVEGELQEIDPAVARVQARREQGRAQSEADLVALGRARGMRRPEAWARHVLMARKAKEHRDAR
jgi:superfamily II DNA or RNA helicase